VSERRCRSCDGEGLRPFLDLGTTPLADALLDAESIDRPEDRFPLRVAFCPDCTLVQILDEVDPHRLFVDNYLYFSSWSDHLLGHARRHTEALIVDRRLDEHSLVVEIASNDGYLLRTFVERGIPVLGIDPAPGPAAAAQAAGIPTITEFFGIDLARRLVAERGRADVVIANNVMAHVPDLNGFVRGLAELVAPDGVVTVENPWVRDLVDRVAFDTIYHEHFCYFSCTAINRLIRRHGLFLNDVDYFADLHGGTLRWTIGRNDAPTPVVGEFLAAEVAAGVTELAYYADFGRSVSDLRDRLRRLLRDLKADGRRVAAYGAAAKGSTLLNYAGIGAESIDFVVDRNPHKHGHFMPGVHLPIRPTEALLDEQPDHVVMLAWNFADEILAQQQEYVRRGGRFIVPVPEPAVVP
jgi:SAM-dependent methyltransferase